MAMGQLSGRNSLRDIVENLSAQTHRLYRLGSAKMSRSNLAGTNEDKPAVLYEALRETDTTLPVGCAGSQFQVC